MNIGRDSVTLEWNPPRSDGGSKIRHYVIERKEAFRNYWTKVGSVEGSRTSYNVLGLTPGSEAFYRVFAENKMGVSEPCQMIASIRLEEDVVMETTIIAEHGMSAIPTFFI